MFTVNASRVRELTIERDINCVTKLAQQARINPGTARKVVREGTTASLKTIGALAKLFNVGVNELITPRRNERSD